MATRASALALRAALLYAGLAAAWILFSDHALVAFANDSDTFSRLEIYKGWAFVVVTAAMLYVALRRQLKRFEDEAEARRQAAERLADREQHLNTVLRTTLDGFWLVDRTGRLLEVNEAYCAMSGFSREELLRMHIADLECAETKDEIAAHMDRVVREGRDRFETRHRRKDGGVIEVEVGAAYVELAGGRFVGYCRDITEQKQAQRLIQHQELLLREAGEIAHLGGWEFDPVTFKGTWTAETARIHDVDPTAEVSAHLGLSCVQGESRKRIEAAIKAAIEHGRPYDLELELVTSKGNRKWVRTICHPVVEGGRTVRVRGTLQDITELKRTEAALRESEQQYRLLVDHASEAIYVVQDGIVQFANRKCAEWSGVSQADLVGRSIYDFTPAEDRPRAMAHNRRLIHGSGGPLHAEFRLCAPGGRLLWFAVSSVRIAWKGGLATLNLATNVTGRKAAEGALRTSEERLRLAVKEDITARKQAAAERERLEAQLRQAQKLEAIGTLAGGIAHDFNNILGAILGNAQLAVADLEAGHPARESLDEIIKASRRAKDLVTQILAFSRQQPAHREVTSLQPVVQEGLRLLRATLPADVEIATSLAADTPPVLADTSQIHQVVVNLGTNAWHALEGRPGRIGICLRGVTVSPGVVGELIDLPPGRYACLAITDNGCGMDSQLLERMFDPFYTTKAPGQGTGLGLAVVDGIVRKHEGRIRVTSTPGQGTTVRVYLPAAEATRKVEAPAKPVVLHGQGQRILFVDDEDPLVLVTTRLLARLGYEVAGFSRPAEALAAFRATPHQFDLAIADCSMPGLSGLQLAAELLALRPELPVLLCSGYITEALEAEGRRTGIRRWLLKPTPIEELSKILNQLWLESKRP